MRRKTDIAIEHFERNEIKAALRIASEFRIGILEIDRKQMKRGYECLVNPVFYQQIGFVPSVETAKAIEIFNSRIYKPHQERVITV